MQAKILFLILAVVHTSSLYAQTVYKGVDRSGKVIYSDKPFENSEAVEIEPLPTYSTPKLNVPVETPKHQVKAVEYQIQILQPNADQTFSTTAQEVQVQLSVTPQLEAQDRIQLLLNGQPQGEPTNNLMFNLGRLDRGAYTLEAQIIDVNAPNQPKAVSNKVTFYQQRTHINKK